MSTLSRSLLIAACGGIVLISSANSAWANPNPDEPTTLEVFQLPKYCQGQFIEKLRGTPGYTMPDCGVWMNHYCYGLNFLNRANNPASPKAKRQGDARRARTDINYTIQHMTAGCAISKDVEAANMRLRAIEMSVK
jgi:hypothetical protein